jgi:CubicO group peptidase (beta-lactamase class C family)
MLKVLDEAIKNNFCNIAGVVVLKNNEKVYENYFNECNANNRVHVYSVTKSVISILLGIAIDKGYIKGINEKILNFFPDYVVKKNEKLIQSVTIKDLITMTVPYKYKFAPYTYIKYFMSDDWINFSLNLIGGKSRIGDFKYAPLVGPDILSGILVNSTGQSVLNFASENLFLPLGINVDKNIIFHSAKEQREFNKSKSISGWVSDSKGINSAGWGLTLSPIDMAKIGQLYLNGGLNNNNQIVSNQWVNDSTREHSRWNKFNLSYGYLWWIIDDKEKSCAAMGDGGNIIYFNSKKKMVVSIASFFIQNAKDRIDFIKNNIEPIFDK